MCPAANRDATTSFGLVGALVRSARMQRGMSLRRLALDLGVSAATLSQIENGKTDLTVTRLAAIAHALETTVPELLAERPGGAEQARPALRAADSAGPAAERRAPHWREYEPLDFDVVLTAAVDEFSERGYNGASVRDIARRCRLSVSTLYHHYPSKHAMLVAIENKAAADLTWRLSAARDEGTNPLQRLSLLVECLVLNHCYRAKVAFVDSRSEMGRVEPETRQHLIALSRTRVEMVSQEVQAGIASGTFSCRFPRQAVRAVMSMCSAISQWFRMDGPLTPQELAEQYVELAMQMMSAPAGRKPT